MAVRTPVYLDGTSIRDMSTAQITAVKQRCVYLFGGANRPVNLTYDAGNTGTDIRRMLDTSDSPSDEVHNNRSFSNNTSSLGNTTDGSARPSDEKTTYDYIAMSTNDGSPSEPADTNNIAFPLYQESTGILRSMTRDDMYDTFINDAIDLLVDGNDRDGTYRISTESTTLADHTIVNSNPIFTDTNFDKSIHGAVTSTTTLNILPLSGSNTIAVANWYLWRTNQGTSYDTPSIVLPIKTDTNQDFVQYSAADFDTLLENLLFYSAASRTNYRIRYDIEGDGQDAFTISSPSSTPMTRGDAITDSTLDSQVRINDQDGDTYRSQNLPTGASETETTYTLKIYRI